jgi:TPR repeat protein
MPQALTYLQEAVSRGHIPATSELGIAYIYGLGVPQDLREAETLLRKSAAANEPNALFHLYYILVRKARTLKEFQEAFHLLKEASNQEYPPALFELGLCYFWGQGIPVGSGKAFPQDFAKAAEYWNKASKFGVSEATGHLGLLYFFGGHGVEKDPQRGLNLLKETAMAEGYNIYSWYNLGVIYMGALGPFGIDTGIPVDYEKALEWLTPPTTGIFMPTTT